MEGTAFLALLGLVERELLLFAGFFFLLGAVDELLVDGLWGWMRLTGDAELASGPALTLSAGF